MIHWIEVIALVCGILLSILLAFFPRFGAGSRHLILLLLPACISAGVQAFGTEIAGITPQNSIKISLSMILFASTGGYLACNALKQQIKPLQRFLIIATTICLVALLYFTSVSDGAALDAPKGHIALGPVAYAAALFLLILSVIVLASLEQILRSSSETERWELKFLILGIGALYAAIIYMSSQTLLFPRSGLLFISSLGLFHFIFLLSSGLIILAWKRGSGKTRIGVSHRAIYSSITLLSVGVYLIASSLIARWVGKWGDIGLPIEALIFLVSIIILVALSLGTGLRHKTRAWIRRNIFAGRYDYRQFWLEATEQLRSTDPLAKIAAALADIVHQAVGAIDISVWVRLWNPNRLRLISSLGTISYPLGQEATGIAEQLLNVSEPLTQNDLEDLQDAAILQDFMRKTEASLLVPLLSSNRVVGVITLGPDRSGRPYTREAREFLRVLAGHAAGEFHKSDLLSTLVEAKEDEAFRSFSTFVLHDLKNFASTLSYIAQNAPRYQHNPEFQKDAFQSVYDTAEKMKRLCNSLRTFSSNPASNKKLVNINQIAQSVADNLLRGVSQNMKREFCDVPEIMADPADIERVVQNLLVNAMEAIPEDGSIILSTGKVGNHVELCVEDNGKGMTREFREKELFQPFHTTKSGGLGIGLFHSKKIMDAHRGAILIDSEEGKGTKVTLRFPVTQEEKELPQIAQIAQK
jgi:putative PEP-CTERM system histidine kinase